MGNIVSENCAILESGKPRVLSIGFIPFPENISLIVDDYISESYMSDYVKTTLTNVQHITLCLSQYVKPELGPCESMGFLSMEQHLTLLDYCADKQFSITDVEGCLSFLDPKGSNYCRMVVDVLEVRLNMTSNISRSALDDLRNTIKVLSDNLGSVNRVIISITDFAFCYFSLKDPANKVTGSPIAAQRVQALLQLIDDLDVCWQMNHMLTANEMLAFYFNGDATLSSKMYLEKFVFLLNDPFNRALLEEQAPNKVSNKIVPAYVVKSVDGFKHFSQDTARLCKIILIDDVNSLGRYDRELLGDHFANAFCFQDNPFVERISINTQHEAGFVVRLPSPSASLPYAMPFSALTELSLRGKYFTLHLTDLNSGYFPNLVHLSVIDGNITGRLDSHRVPSLKTLLIELDKGFDSSRSDVYPLVHGHVQSLIRAGLPWQLVATRKPGGWSLASYDQAITNPQDEVNDDTVHPDSLPLIRELLLVSCSMSSGDEWQAQLEGNPSPEAAVGDHNNRLLVWSPQRVQKITVFSTSEHSVKLEFKELMPEQTRILTSLTCHRADVVLNGNVLPNLQLLELKSGSVTMSGTFLQLQTLAFRDICPQSRCLVDAPLLQSLLWNSLSRNHNLCLNLWLLPLLSFLQITLYSSEGMFYPEIVNLDSDLGLSTIKRVVFGRGMSLFPDFEECHLNDVSQLELDVDPLQPPACWLNNTVWQCETLTVNVYQFKNVHLCSKETTVLTMRLRLPRLKKLTITEKDCHVLLDSEMPELTDCTLPSPRSLGPNLRCPALKRIRFTDELSEEDKGLCLDRATYVAMDAQPSEVIFAADYQMHTMA